LVSLVDYNSIILITVVPLLSCSFNSVFCFRFLPKWLNDNDVTLQIIYNFVVDCLLVDELYILFPDYAGVLVAISSRGGKNTRREAEPSP